MNTCLVLVTHNRLSYTKKCIEYIFKDQISDFDLYIWDNASTDETPEYLMSLSDSRLVKVHLSKENLGQTVAMNQIWQESKAELLSKLDNDCLVTEGWLKTLGEAHRDIPNLGAIACWHYMADDFDERIAALKIKEINGHKIFRHPFVCGSGFVMKRETFVKMKPWPEGSPNIGTTGYFLNMALNGMINGWYYPLILQHHMDDPLSPHCIYTDDKSLRDVRDITFTLRNFNINSMDDRMRRRSKVVRNLMYGSPNAASYTGLKGKLRRFIPCFDKWKVKTRVSFLSWFGMDTKQC